ncbi:conserved hypothetical protein [Candidatus Terasakiella magnetica]|nr:conserved hypothetical protein [Candidatus Terasakiella magnetica]
MASTRPAAQGSRQRTVTMNRELMEELRDRARNAEERAKRYEDELSDLRKRNDELTARLLPPPLKTGLFARWFGG